MPRPMARGVLGMARTTRAPVGSQASSLRLGVPARIDTRVAPAGQAEARSGTTVAAICGLMARTTTSAPAMAARLSVVVEAPRA